MLDLPYEPKPKLTLKKQLVKKCPSCGKAVTSNAFICLGCGFDAMSGKKIPMDILTSRG